MSNNKRNEATSFAKENGFESFKEMMELLAINTAISLLDELGNEYITVDNGWKHVDFIVPALRRIADLNPVTLREQKKELLRSVEFGIKNRSLSRY